MRILSPSSRKAIEGFVETTVETLSCPSQGRSSPGFFWFLSWSRQMTSFLKVSVISEPTEEWSVWNSFRKRAEQRKSPRIIFYDLYKAFDSVHLGNPQKLWMPREIHGAHSISIRVNDGLCPTAKWPFGALFHYMRFETRLRSSSYPILHLLGGNDSGESRR